MMVVTSSAEDGGSVQLAGLDCKTSGVCNAFFLCGLLMLTWVPELLAQGSFMAQGGEYKVLGDLPGDQIHPSVAVGLGRGYLVWQDNGSTAAGTSIKLKRLQGLQPDGFGHYAVNTSETNRNEFPQVTLMADGSAVVVWQQVRPGGSDVCARFIDPTGVFSTKEVVLNVHRPGDQGHPAVAPLVGGGVVVVWSSYGQDGSMNGVFGRVFDAVGNPVGGEFQANVTTAFNQKDPAVASLSGGGFVVAWVSEQQRFANSVDAYARTFGPAGNPLGGEVRLNTGNEMAMAPAVSGNANGGFVAAWMQRDATDTSNGWDIHYGTFGAGGAVVQPPMRLNLHQFGDQYSPRISPTGVEHLVVWTSLGQDGSQEGVYGVFV